MLERIVSGGQTGADRAALDVAIEVGIPHGGWCPRGRRAEDGAIDKRYQLCETDSADYRVRTEKNVLDSDATVVITRGAPTGGSALTLRLARRHKKRLLHIDLDGGFEAAVLALAAVFAEVAVVNIAGPRESTTPGIGTDVKRLLRATLATTRGYARGMSRERRREPRYPYRLPITLKFGGGVQETISEDISYRGMFAITDEPPNTRQLISLSAKLPEGAAIDTHAMTVFVLERGNRLGRTPGVGLQFYAMAGEVKTAWEGFIDSVRRKLSPPVPENNPREYVRYRLKLAVRPKNLDELMTLYSRDVSRGGMFLLTAEAPELGRTLAIDIFHPLTDEVFTLECIVRRASPGPPPGVGVEFHKLDDRGRRAFGEFVHSALPELDDADIELIEADDPALE